VLAEQPPNSREVFGVLVPVEFPSSAPERRWNLWDIS
jgi:hypothetical protein